MRARLEATEAASQPLTIAQGSQRCAWERCPAVHSMGLAVAARRRRLAGPHRGDATATLGWSTAGSCSSGLWLTLGLAALVLVPVVVFYALPEE